MKKKSSNENKRKQGSRISIQSRQKRRTRAKTILRIPISLLIIIVSLAVVMGALIGVLWQYYTIHITGDIDVTGNPPQPPTLYYDDQVLNEIGNETMITTLDYTVLNPSDAFTTTHHFDNIGEDYFKVTLNMSGMPLNYTDPEDLWYGLTIKAYEHGTTNELTTFVISPTSIYEFDLYYAVHPLFLEPEVAFPFNLQIEIERYDTVISPEAGDIIISEMMINPSAVSDVSGEWFEIVNVGSQNININGCNISDAGTDYFLITGDFIIPPGEHIVLCSNGDYLSNGGVPCDIEYTNFVLSNINDEIIISLGSTVIDQVIYDNSWVFVGSSSQLSFSYYDYSSNDNLANWCQSVDLLPGGDFGSPGIVNDVC